MHSRSPVFAALDRLMSFAQWLKVHRMLVEIAVEPKQTFWNMTINLLFDAAAVEWAKVFGSWSEDTHWTKALPPEQHDATRAALLGHLGLTAEQWATQKEAIKMYRDQHVSHHDVDSTIAKLPHYDIAFKAACFMFDRIRAVADQNWLGGIPDDLERWSNTVAGNMSVIVRKAHAATATLGSNVPSAKKAGTQ
jgi:hypothetical protein